MTVGSVALGPFKLRASLHETIWGGQRLRELVGKSLPEGKRIGEAWETDLNCLVDTPPHAGKSLGAMVEAFGVDLLGSRAVSIYGHRFPLLAKFIDANDWLSVQAHPDDEYAAQHENGKLGKTETWYILAAQPGAQIVYGFAREVSRAEVNAAIAANALEPLMRTTEVHAGDIVYVPAGTVHAIGAGVALYELQEYSDVTYRLYDYGRRQANGQPRELHVERALDVVRYSPAPVIALQPTALPTSEGLRARKALVACHYFVEEEITLASTFAEPAFPSSCRILTALSGHAEVIAEGFAPVSMQTGDTVVLPASLGPTIIHGDATLVRSWVPERDDATWAAWKSDHRALFSED